MSSTNHLRVENLSKTYRRGVKAIDGLSFEVQNGIFGLLGPNGAGKSTLMRTIAGLQEPDVGTIHFNDVDILAQPQYIRNQLGYLPQDFGVYPGMSTWQLMEHLAILKGMHQTQERHSQIEQLLHHTNLYNYRKKAVSTFSGGMRQRFGVAQALLGNPQLVIVDEPTAGLDPEERNRFLDLLSELGEEKVVILSTHIVEDVRDLCRQVAIIHEGKLVEQGEPDKLIGQLKRKVWRRVMKKQAEFEAQPNQYLLSSRLFAGQRRVHVLADQLPGEGFEAVEPSLEDVYFSTFQRNSIIA